MCTIDLYFTFIHPLSTYAEFCPESEGYRRCRYPSYWRYQSLIDVQRLNLSSHLVQIHTTLHADPTDQQRTQSLQLRALTHIDQNDTYVIMLFIDFSLTFNTIIPYNLVNELRHSLTLYKWILDFHRNRRQTVRMGHHTSAGLTLSSGTHQGCVLIPLLYSLFTHDCSPIYTTNTVIKVAGGTDTQHNWDVLQRWCLVSETLVFSSQLGLRCIKK